MTTLIIARHGNTFEAGEPPRRVGGRTDIPLVQSGRDQAVRLGQKLQADGLIPEQAFASKLHRALDTAQIALETMGLNLSITRDTLFNEIDYGPDEDKTEDAVIERVGAKAIQDWNETATPPKGWIVEPAKRIKDWQDFAAHHAPCNQTILIVTSNGTARFAPHISGDFEGFRKTHDIKLSTGAYGVIKFENGGWHVQDWNVKP